MVEPDRNNFPNLLHQVKHYLKEISGEKMPYAQHLHRLDRVTSGIVLFTKQKEHLRYLSEQFAQRAVTKYYTAITAHSPLVASINNEQTQSTEATGNEITLEHWHRKEKKKAVLVPEGTPFAEKVKLTYTVQPYGKFFRWNIQLYTGKYHQIRVQLASIGCPILGDILYGSTDAYHENAIALHAAKLTIQHPVTHQQLQFEAPEPKWFYREP